MSNIGKNIKKERERLGWTQEELARRMGYTSKTTINKVEMGINDIPQRKIMKYAEVLGVAPGVLMGWITEEGNRKNDALADIVVKLRKDTEFFEVVSLLADVPAEQYALVKQLFSVIGKK